MERVSSNISSWKDDQLRVPMAGCNGTHRYYVATDGAVEATGSVFVIIVCTACGDSMKKEFKVAEPGLGISLSDNKIKGE